MKGCAIGIGDLAIPTASTLIATAWNTTKGLSGPQGAETEPNARFIVQACNAHEELLAACEAVLNRVAAAERGRMAPAKAAFALLRAAIAKATREG